MQPRHVIDEAKVLLQSDARRSKRDQHRRHVSHEQGGALMALARPCGCDSDGRVVDALPRMIQSSSTLTYLSTIASPR
jgi:hypothetical protein